MLRRVTGFSVTRIRRRQGFLWIPACAGMTEGAGTLSCPDTLSPRPAPGRGEGDGGASVMPAGTPLLCPLVLLCHARRLLAGIQCFAFLSLYSCGPARENHGFLINNVENDSGGRGNDSGGIGNDGGRLNMSGMTEEGLNTWGMTEGLLWVLCHAPTPPHPGPLPEGERETGGTSVMPAGPPLLCPLVVSGNPVSFFVPLFVWACMGKPWIPD